ncbi:hypothetical protein [Burkholderia ambifaria]|uniref:hypothetical protein n=1 Tax=Burkholderia ambifaria TaxID=152480 RepID=UPI001FC8CC59|nr:hypothetical protein [Burkholderia ambifaria]
MELARKSRSLQFGDLCAELTQRVGYMTDVRRSILLKMNEDDRQCRRCARQVDPWFQIPPFAPAARLSGMHRRGRFRLSNPLVAVV